VQIGKDGHPVELHDRNQKSNSPPDEMACTDHRLGDNFKKNHPNKGQSPPKIGCRLKGLKKGYRDTHSKIYQS
jgi:hypothetical protein